MILTEKELSIRNAIRMYLNDSSRENYQRLKVTLFREREGEYNLFQALANVYDADRKHDRDTMPN